MAQQFKRAKRGDPFQIPAQTYNAILDTTERSEREKFAREAKPVAEPLPAGMCYLYNGTGDPVGRFDVMGWGSNQGQYNADTPVIQPGVNLEQFQKQLILHGTVPSSPGEGAPGQFAICYDAIPAGKIGRAYIYGVCPAQVNVTDSSHQFCGMYSGDTTQLSSGLFGPAEIVWRADNTTGVMWCVVRLGGFVPLQTAVGKPVLGAAVSKPFIADSGGNLAQVTPAAAGTYSYVDGVHTRIDITLGAGGVVTAITIT